MLWDTEQLFSEVLAIFEEVLIRVGNLSSKSVSLDDHIRIAKYGFEISSPENSWKPANDEHMIRILTNGELTEDNMKMYGRYSLAARAFHSLVYGVMLGKRDIRELDDRDFTYGEMMLMSFADLNREEIGRQFMEAVSL